MRVYINITKNLKSITFLHKKRQKVLTQKALIFL